MTLTTPDVDSLIICLKHLVQEGDVFVTGEKLISVGITECLKRTTAAIGWRENEEQLLPSPGKNIRRGKGLAVTIKSTTTPTTSSANVRLNADGSAILFTSSVDMGQGALTSLAQIVGDELGLPFDKVSVSVPDTDITPYDKSTSSSRTTFSMGQAAQKAAREVRNQLLEVGAKKLEARVEDLELREGAVWVRGVPSKREVVKFLVENFLSSSCLIHHAADFVFRDSACSVSIAAITVLISACPLILLNPCSQWNNTAPSHR